MGILDYPLAALVSYLGLIAGMIIAFYTEEELLPGKKYFEIIKHVCLISIFGFVVYDMFVNKYWVFFGLVLLLFCVACYLCYYFGVKHNKLKRPISKYQIIYLILAFLFYLSSKNIVNYLVSSSLIFIHGIACGTLLTEPKKKLRSFGRVIGLISFVVIAIVLKLVLL